MSNDTPRNAPRFMFDGPNVYVLERDYVTLERALSAAQEQLRVARVAETRLNWILAKLSNGESIDFTETWKHPLSKANPYLVRQGLVDAIDAAMKEAP